MIILELLKKLVNRKTKELKPMDKPVDSKKKDDEKKKVGTPFLPWPAGTSPYHKRRIENGGTIVRLQRK